MQEANALSKLCACATSSEHSLLADGIQTKISFNNKTIRGSLRVKSGKFGHTFASSVNPDETAPYEPSHQDFHCLLS